MRLLKPEERLSGHGACFICETFIARDDPSKGAVDTGIPFDPPFQHPLAGDKVVCTNCVNELGYAVGMVRGDDVAAAAIAVEEQRRQLSELRGQVQGLLESVQDSIENTKNLPAVNVSSVVVDAVKEQARDEDGVLVAVTDKEKKSG